MKLCLKCKGKGVKINRISTGEIQSLCRQCKGWGKVPKTIRFDKFLQSFARYVNAQED